MCFLLHTLPFLGLRIKICHLHSFGIITKYYSQGIKPLRLCPLSNLSSSFPLPTLWKLSPISLFLRYRSVRRDVYILLMIFIFNCMHPGRHLSSWRCMRSIFHMLELHVLPLPGLRIKTCLSHNFDNKILFSRT